MRGHARLGQPAGADADEAREIVGRAQVDEAAVDLRLAVEHRAHGLASERRRHLSVERTPVAAEGAEPGDLERSVRGREVGGRLGERSVLHHEPAGEHRGDRRRAGDDADRHQHEPLPARAEPRPREPEGKEDAPQRDHAAALRRRLR